MRYVFMFKKKQSAVINLNVGFTRFFSIRKQCRLVMFSIITFITDVLSIFSP